MQTDYLFYGLKGFLNFQRVCYLWDMETNVAQKRLKIINFFEKYGLEATLEAFDISKRTLYRWRALYKNSNGDILSLSPHSKAPKKKRTPKTPPAVVKKIKYFRENIQILEKQKSIIF